MSKNIVERLTDTASDPATVVATRMGKLSENSRLFIGAKSYDMTNDIYPYDIIADCRLNTC